MPKEKSSMNKDDPAYLAKRAKNNEAIKKSREKARQKANETKEKVDSLKSDNKRLEDKISVLDQEMKFLKDIFIAHAQGNNGASATATSEQETAKDDAKPVEQNLMDLLNDLDPSPGPSGSH